ncbi:hypothetical protein AMK26_07205 [Streptomyces sp. CB03234]|uniref:hypothetical protein n=1 Tax=Streptomyces sp. (strain CB03234) TaxID=1703937 RepID=UPI00093EFA8F|nr:hypothetical protein [Streptomyces sp. CB03234]OKK05885.1 hypothetical protein AMK26_07205 [Streptomyces sp. CB03234]
MHPRPLIAALALTALASFALGIAPAAPAPGARDDTVRADLLKAYRATVKYQSVERAVADGYKPMRGCVSRPEGGMGYHYVNKARNNSTDPAKPSALMYEDTENGKRLTGIEFFVEDRDQKVATDDDRPTMFGQPFLGPSPGVEAGVPVHYDLHVWLYKHNPRGMFTEWNPKVRCPGEA